MRAHYIGNFQPAHSTETHVALALESNGHEVTRVQENDINAWQLLHEPADLILWTRTGGFAPNRELEYSLAGLGPPVVGYHLDRWWGLDREGQVFDEPFFQVCDLMLTADGGHDKEWADANVDHVWFPPAVSEPECELGEFRRRYASEIAFVGSWRPGYHEEWTHRPQLIEFLRETYGGRVKFWPEKGQHAIRGKGLRDLYASTGVVVGDSCLVPNADGTPCIRYFSDRVPETIGRGGYLLHPYVDAVIPGLYRSGEHLRAWPLWEWEQLEAEIDDALAHPDDCQRVASQGREHVLATATYEVRMRELVALLKDRGMA